MDRKKEIIEGVATGVSILFSIAIALYLCSRATAGKELFGQGQLFWKLVWIVSENALPLSLCFVVIMLTKGLIHNLIKWVLIPFFIFKLIFYVINYSKIYIWPYEVWIGIIIAPLLAGLIYCTYLRWHEKREN